ncbi:hypothetical protein CCACVL1_18555 [Corchorus capsularis]|uniref:Oxidative stress 3 n=1 Tax=Corchorus capsularis TaxID=210143 RepID=A0A1R3HL14_COCAP|nr:hypothetical protein CCACVL1_18555 [Corchorus capsularis]
MADDIQGDDLKGMMKKSDNDHHHHCWMNMEGINHHHNINDHDDDDDDDVITSSSSESSMGEFSRTTTSQGSTSSSSDLVDDASSSSNSSINSNNNNGPLFQLSELMAQLPIKRGLSKYFEGKSQSFTTLSSVKSLEDLVKKETPYNNYSSRKRMKSCKSYGGGLDGHRLYTLPRATISKKVTRNSIPSLSFPARRGSFLSGGAGRPPLIPVQKNFSPVS